METEKTYRLPNWAVILIAIFVGLLVWYITKPDPQDVKKAEAKKEVTQSKIDSLGNARKDFIKDVVTNSQTQATKSEGLIKKLNDEKIIIPDTTYNAMFEYIANYKQ